MLPRTESWKPFWSENSTTWAVDFRVDGRRFRRRLPITDRASRDLAYEMARELYREAWQGALDSKTRIKEQTFSEAASDYITSGGEARFLPKIIAYFGNDTPVSSIDTQKIVKATAALYPDAKPETVRRQLRVPIRAVQNFAAGHRREKIPDTRRFRWLTPEEAERLLAAAADPAAAGLHDPNKHTLRKIAFMLGSGAGPAETFALDVKGWNAASGEWWLNGTKTVFRPRFVCLPERSVTLIGDLPLDGKAFRAPNGQPYKLSKNRGGQMAEAFSKVRQCAGLDADVIPYTLRHTWATWFYAQTKDWGALLDQGGWSRSDTANRYRKIAPADLGNRLLAHGWDFRRHPGSPVRFGELVSI